MRPESTSALIPNARNHTLHVGPGCTGRIYKSAYQRVIAAARKMSNVLRTLGARDWRKGQVALSHPLHRGLISFLAETFVDVAFCTFLANDHDAPTEAALYGDMLVSLGLHKSITSRSSAWQRRRALVAGLIALAEARNAGCIVVFVDEAQNYTPPDLTRLRDVSNELGLHGISLQTIFFGTDQLSAAKVGLREKDRDDIVGRFLLNKYEYRGIESISELHALLSLCDDPSMCPYPEGSDISITEFFMPEQYASAWRLAQEAERLYALLCPRGKNRDMQVGMQTLSETIRTFLFRKWTGVAASPENLDVGWRESLESARRWP